MDQPKRKPRPSPVVVTDAEKLREQVLEIEAEAQLADERRVLDELRQKEEEAKTKLTDIRARIDRLKQELGSSEPE